jgi:hypothetical protein
MNWHIDRRGCDFRGSPLCAGQDPGNDQHNEHIRREVDKAVHIDKVRERKQVDRFHDRRIYQTASPRLQQFRSNSPAKAASPDNTGGLYRFVSQIAEGVLL